MAIGARALAGIVASLLTLPARATARARATAPARATARASATAPAAAHPAATAPTGSAEIVAKGTRKKHRRTCGGAAT